MVWLTLLRLANDPFPAVTRVGLEVVDHVKSKSAEEQRKKSRDDMSLPNSAGGGPRKVASAAAIRGAEQVGGFL